MDKKRVLITGVAGFIGYSLTAKLAKENDYEITGLDSINDYYDQDLKYARLEQLGLSIQHIKEKGVAESTLFKGLKFIQLELENKEAMYSLFALNRFDIVIHLAAQAGVRYSLTNPHTYISSNILGFVNILECCRQNQIQHLIYASSSSVYGLDSTIPFSEKQETNHPVSLYAATKKSNELMAHTYSHLYNLPVTGLRFFTVYGPWGRPDMSPMLFAKAIFEGKPIRVFNYGKMKRDFTYIDDVVEGISGVLKTDPGPYQIYNIGNSAPVDLLNFIELMEKLAGRSAIKEFVPMQPGDVYETYADVSSLSAATGYRPVTSIETGIQKFINWYIEYYGLEKNPEPPSLT